MTEFYCPGQVSSIYPHINFVPKWFILGGPDNGDEAQVIKRDYPNVSVIGLEPDRACYDFQVASQFPGTLIQKGLWSSAGTHGLFTTANGGVLLSVPYGRNYPLSYKVETTTLDQLDSEYGPFIDGILWLDIEGSEMDALQGGEKLLSRSDGIRLMDIEIIEEHMKDETKLLDVFKSYLGQFGYGVAGMWNCTPLGGVADRFRRDVVFRKGG
jgi:FkbM family methyltransferase